MISPVPSEEEYRWNLLRLLSDHARTLEYTRSALVEGERLRQAVIRECAEAGATVEQIAKAGRLSLSEVADAISRSD